MVAVFGSTPCDAARSIRMTQSRAGVSPKSRAAPLAAQPAYPATAEVHGQPGSSVAVVVRPHLGPVNNRASGL